MDDRSTLLSTPLVEEGDGRVVRALQEPKIEQADDGFALTDADSHDENDVSVKLSAKQASDAFKSAPKYDGTRSQYIEWKFEFLMYPIFRIF